MNRIARMVLRNTLNLPRFFGKLWRYAKNPDNYPEGEKWAHIQEILKAAVAQSNVELIVSGQENIPTEGGCMFYANHQGMFDVVAVAATCHRPMGAVLKKELENVPLVHQIALCTKSFYMDREDVRQSLTVIQGVTEEVKKGRAYLIFPEGTRSRNGNTMGAFHGGSFRCATKGKCTVIPIAFVDSFRPLDEKGSAPMTAQIHYLEPIPYEEHKSLKPQELADLVQSRIQAKIDQCT